MTLEISISPKAEAKLREKAAAVGQDITDYAAGVLERIAEGPDLPPLPRDFSTKDIYADHD